MIDGISKKAFASFCQRERIALAVLFGSRANGRATPRSDLDLAFWLTGRQVDGQELRLTNELMRTLHCNDVDVVVLNHANPLLQWQIATTAQPLYERYPGAFRQFQLRAFKRHHDAGRIYRWTREYLTRVVARVRHA